MTSRQVHVQNVPGYGSVKFVSHDPNDESSGSSVSSSPEEPPLTVNQGSLTLAQFVAFIEENFVQNVDLMQAQLLHRLFRMPFTPPNANDPAYDRFSGHGDQLVEDVVYGVLGRQRLSIHEIIPFMDINLYHDPQASVVYILSLAVSSAYRRKGIATILLNQLYKNVVNLPPYPKIVFLHVLHSNHEAIKFYLKNGFRYHATLNGYYLIDNSYQDGYSFVLYTNNARPPWSFKEFYNVILSFICLPFRWLVRWKIC